MRDLDPTTYTVPTPLMQQVIGILTTLPWGQVEGVMSPLRDLIRAQEEEYAKSVLRDRQEALK